MDNYLSNTDLSKITMEDYVIAAKQANWGIDVDEIPKLKKMRDLDLNPDLNRYLDRLLSMDFPWTLDDKKLLNNLWDRLQTIEKYSFFLQPLILVNIYFAAMISYLATFVLLFQKLWVIQNLIFTANKYWAMIILFIIIGSYIILKYSAKAEDNIVHELSSTYHIRQSTVEGVVLSVYIFCMYFFFFIVVTSEMMRVELYYGDHIWFLTLFFIIFAIGLYAMIFLITIRIFEKFLIRWKMKKTINQIVSANRNTIREMYRENGKIEIVGNK